MRITHRRTKGIQVDIPIKNTAEIKVPSNNNKTKTMSNSACGIASDREDLFVNIASFT
jgi:hypothetical protein